MVIPGEYAEPKPAHNEGKQYRLFSLDNSGRISTPPRIVACADDKAVMEKAVQLLGDQCIEVWDEARLVIRLAPQKH
jgi:DNA-binding transcriptional regulator/RsmH inhibitor MraZ